MQMSWESNRKYLGMPSADQTFLVLPSRACIAVYMCIFVFIYICVYLYIYIYVIFDFPSDMRK